MLTVFTLHHHNKNMPSKLHLNHSGSTPSGTATATNGNARSRMTSGLKRQPLNGLLAGIITALSLAACSASPNADKPSAGIASLSTATAPLLPAPAKIPTRVGKLAVWDTGPVGAKGETIVLWPSILSDHRIYRRQIEAWRGQHRLIVIDGPGHGQSGPAPGPFSMADCGQALTEVLDTLGINTPVVVMGTSWGGLVAGEFALAQAKRTRAVVMLNTPVFTAPDGPGFSDRFVVWGAKWIHGTQLYRDGVARAFFLPATRENGSLLMDDFHQHLRNADGAALAQSVRSVLIDREALAPRMRGIAAPTLFVVGKQDSMYPMDTLREAAATLPKGRFEILDTAHISVVDRPDDVTKLVDRFVAQIRQSDSHQPAR